MSNKQQLLFRSHRAPGPGARLVALWVALVALFAGPAFAQQQETIDSPYRWIERKLRLGLYGGYYAASRGNLDHGPGSTPLVGLQFRARVSSPLSFEGSVEYGPSSRYVIDPRLETGPAPVDTVAANWLNPQVGVQVGLTGARTWHGIHPFLRVGGGLMIGLSGGKSDALQGDSLLVESIRYDFGTQWNLYFGVGGELFPSDRIGLSFEIRDTLLRLTAPDGWFTEDILRTIAEAEGEAPRQSQWTHNFVVSLGLFYYF